jgi:CHAT domain-containing protein/tetratricopeptide (TPR) repeat protein
MGSFMPRSTARGIVFGVLFGFLLVLPPAAAGDAKDLNALAGRSSQLEERGDVEGAIAAAEQALALAERKDGPESVLAANVADHLGLLYRSAGRFAESERSIRRAISIREKITGPGDPTVLHSLHELAVLFFGQGRYQEAEVIFSQVLEGRERLPSPDYGGIASTAYNLAAVYLKEGRFAEAEPLFKRSLDTRMKTFGPDDASVGISLGGLAGLQEQQGRYEESERVYRRSISVLEKALGPNHARVRGGLNNLANLYITLGRYRDAEALLRRLISSSPNSEGEEAATNLANLASALDSQARYREAEDAYKQAIAVHERALGPDHPGLATVLANLANLYSRLGRSSEYEVLQKRAISLLENAYGPDHPEVSSAQTNLAWFYTSVGRNAEAEVILKRTLTAEEKSLGPDHPTVAQTLGALAHIYGYQGRLAEAEALYKRSLAITEKALGAGHPDLAAPLGALGNLYADEKRFAEALPLFEQALRIEEQMVGPDHPDTAEALARLGMNNASLGHYAEAETLLKRSIAAREKALGKDNPEVGHGYNTLSLVYLFAHRYKEAQKAASRSLVIQEKAFGADHPDTVTGLDNLGSIAFAQKDWRAAAEYFRRASAIVLTRIRRGADIYGKALTTVEESRRADNAEPFHDLVKALYREATNGARDPAKLAGEALVAAQRATQSETASSLAQMSARTARGDSTLAGLVRERQDLVAGWQAADASLTKSIAESAAKRDSATEKQLRDRLTSIDEQIAKLDQSLAREFPDYAALANPEPLSLEEIKELLRPSEALLFYSDTDALSPAGSETYLWAIVPGAGSNWWRLKWPPDMIAKKITELRDLIGVGQRGATVMADDTTERRFDLATAHELYATLIGLDEAAFKGKDLIIVPSRSMSSLPFQLLVSKPPDALSHGPSAYREAPWLIRDHAVTVLPSVASLKALRHDTRASAASKPYLGIGDPLITGGNDLDRRAWDAQSCLQEPGPTLTAAAKGMNSRELSSFFRGSLADIAEVKGLMPLPETAGELCAVATSLGGDADSVMLGSRATEFNLKKMSAEGDLAKARVVHFATHGLIAGDLKDLAEPSLVLTPPDQPSEVDDGLLTASEVTALKLDADWVILSACNTAAGENGNAEALSGLARAFFYAGARALLVSHWPVNSQAAVELTTRTLGMLAKEPGIGRAEALRRAMLSLIDEDGEKADPAYWAPFVLVGDSG